MINMSLEAVKTKGCSLSLFLILKNGRGKSSMDPNLLEESYQGFVKNLPKWLPDGVTHINLPVLLHLGLLSDALLEQKTIDQINHSFHVMETPEKITLFNEQFAIWIVPQNTDQENKTLTFISLLQGSAPHLEIVFETEGVYNTPRYIMKILQHYLTEVLDIEEVIASIGKRDHRA